MSEGKSSVTTLTLMPSFPRSACTMTAMRSLGLLPALVTMENSTALPPLSNNAPFCRWKPSACRRFQAASGRYGSALSLLLNQNLLAGETGPTAGWA